MAALEVTVRANEFGKGAARKLRATGQVPGVVYGPGGGSVSLSLDPKDLLQIFKESANRNTIVELQIDGSSVKSMVRSVQRHPVTRDLLHVDFYRIDPDLDVEVMVPVRTVGRPAGAVLGGRVRLVRRTLSARCKPGNIPEAFEIDVSHMNVNDMVMASEVVMPPGVKLVMEGDFSVISLYGKRQVVEKEEEEEEGTETEADAEAGAEA
jgi:large subunit ribosomal protein L25